MNTIPTIPLDPSLANKLEKTLPAPRTTLLDIAVSSSSPNPRTGSPTILSEDDIVMKFENDQLETRARSASIPDLEPEASKASTWDFFQAFALGSSFTLAVILALTLLTNKR